MRGSATSGAPTVSPSPWRRCAQRPQGTPAACRSATASGGNRGCLLGRLRDHRVAGGERRGDLAREDGEREVPGADAGKDAAAVQGELVALARRSGHEVKVAKFSRPQSVIAAEIDRLAAIRRSRPSPSCRPRGCRAPGRRRAPPPACRRRGLPGAPRVPWPGLRPGYGKPGQRRRDRGINILRRAALTTRPTIWRRSAPD